MANQASIELPFNRQQSLVKGMKGVQKQMNEVEVLFEKDDA